MSKQFSKNQELNLVTIRLVKDRTLYSDIPIHSPEDAVRLLARELADYDREVLAVVNLQTDGKPINLSIVSTGSLDGCIVSPPNVFKAAILSNANSIMLLHNHPSGSCNPSKEDRLVTDRIKKCGELLGIRLTDHVILGHGKYYSFTADNVYTFSSTRDEKQQAAENEPNFGF